MQQLSRGGIALKVIPWDNKIQTNMAYKKKRRLHSTSTESNGQCPSEMPNQIHETDTN